VDPDFAQVFVFEWPRSSLAACRFFILYFLYHNLFYFYNFLCHNLSVFLLDFLYQYNSIFISVFLCNTDIKSLYELQKK
jgi:hypothetical protein